MTKKLTVSLALGLACFTPQARTTNAANIPDWVNAADDILASIDGFADALASDALLYTSWRNALEQLHGEFDKRDYLRRQVFESIRTMIHDLQASMKNCQATSELAAASAHLREQNLLNQLSAIKLETASEIKYLNGLVKELSEELAATREAYSTLIHLDEEKADELIRNLCQARDNYETMVEKRAEFLETLNAFVDRTRAFLYTNMIETEGLGQEFCALTQPTEQPRK